MHEHGLAKEIWPQLEGIARINEFKKVYYVEMIVGMLHGVTAEFLEHSFEHAFEGTNFQGADVDVTIVEIGQEYKPPGSNEKITANGWELLIVRIEGEK